MNDTQFYVIGYYDHGNLGDEQYKETFDLVLRTYLGYCSAPVYVDCDKLDTYCFLDTDDIILGGGDVLNTYFLDRMKRTFENRPNRIIAISVGIPYPDILYNPEYTYWWDRFDALFIRTDQDLSTIPSMYKDKVHYIPDLSYFIPRMHSSESILMFEQTPRRIVGLMVSQNIYHSQFPKEYKTCVHALASLVACLVHAGFFVAMLPFNTNEQASYENDIILQTNIYKRIPRHYISHVLNITVKMLPQDLANLYPYFYITLPMRYHATLFSAYYNIPFIPLYTTRKIQNFIKDTQWSLFYNIPTNEQDVPTEINVERILKLVEHVHTEYSEFQKHTKQIVQEHFENRMYYCLLTLQDTLRHNKPQIQQQVSLPYPQQLWQQTNREFEVDDLRQIRDPDMQVLVVQYVSYFLTRGKIDSEYTHGLMTKMFSADYDYTKEWNWILTQDHDRQVHEISDHVNGRFNLCYVNHKPICQNNSENVHRFGWQYVYEHLKPLHNNNSNLFLDLYVDRTFHWNYTINKRLGIVPYYQPWFGFVHHTFDESFSSYNNMQLLRNPDFIESLKYCKGLIVLSKTQYELWIQHLVQYNIHKVKVYCLVHPTETNVQPFSYDLFIRQVQPKIVHVGGWLRDVYAFYMLEVSKPIQLVHKSCYSKVDRIFRKTIVKGKHMNNYFPPKHFDSKLMDWLKQFELNSKQSFVSSQALVNNWSERFYQFIANSVQQIDCIEQLSNEAYDELLSQNIVFIYLIDASAVNTLLECIVRNTPIIINRHPAVVEVLGKNYPLYYDKPAYYEMNKQIEKIYSNPRFVWNAHCYLARLDKSSFKIETFIQHLKQVVSNP